MQGYLVCDLIPSPYNSEAVSTEFPCGAMGRSIIPRISTSIYPTFTVQLLFQPALLATGRANHALTTLLVVTLELQKWFRYS